jgi:hypothetical protein
MPSQPSVQAAFAIALVMDIEDNAVGLLAQQFSQGALALLERRPAQVLAVKFDQVERAEHGGVVVLPVANQVKDREAVLIDNNRLAIDDAGLHGQALDRFGDPGETGGRNCIRSA